MTDLTLWAFFIVFAVLGAFTFVYALRSLGPSEGVERRLMEMQSQDDE